MGALLDQVVGMRGGDVLHLAHKQSLSLLDTSPSLPAIAVEELCRVEMKKASHLKVTLRIFPPVLGGLLGIQNLTKGEPEETAREHSLIVAKETRLIYLQAAHIYILV